MHKRIIEKTIILDRDLVKKIEKAISGYPGLSFTLVVNQALEEWLRGPQSNNKQKDRFIMDAPKGFGPIY